MGTSGSKEQRQCIKALIELNSFKDDDSIEKTLASFCHHFPMKVRFQEYSNIFESKGSSKHSTKWLYDDR